MSTWFAATPDSDYMIRALTDGTVAKMSGGKIPKMTLAQAAGLVGSWIIESGRSISNGGFANFDVIEAGAKAGRGLSQYTGVRRGPYDKIANQAIKAGENVNSAKWQLQYFVNEYIGAYDKFAKGNSLIGWTRIFEKMDKPGANPYGDTPEGWARYFTGSEAEKRGYFRPGEPHQDRRNAAAKEVYQHYQANPITPKVTAPKKNNNNNSGNKKGGGNQFLNKIFESLGIQGAKQTFNFNKLDKLMGNVAANAPVQDIGLAIFASQKQFKKAKEGKIMKAWKKLDNNTQQAYGQLGAQLAISYNPDFSFGAGATPQPYTMPQALEMGSGTDQYLAASNDFGFTPMGSPGMGSFGVGDIGGLPGLLEVAEMSIGLIPANVSSSYAISAFSMSEGTVGGINQASYGGTMDLGGSLGINTAATAAAGNAYGNAAMTMNTAAINAAAWGGGGGGGGGA